MPRRVRDSRLETRTARNRLKVQHKPYFRQIEPGLFIGYRRLANQPGPWSGRRYAGNEKYVTETLRTSDGRLVVADDFADSDGLVVVGFAEAQDRVRQWARVGVKKGDGASDDDISDSEEVITVSQAIDRYEADLKRRGGDHANAARVRVHLPRSLGAKRVSSLVTRHFHAWDEALKEAELTAASITRSNTAFAAALTLAADKDDRIVNQKVWKKALAGIADSNVASNTNVAPQNAHKIVAASYEQSVAFGLFVEVSTQTGARPAQLCRLDMCDLQDDRKDDDNKPLLPRLMMPSSKKGKSGVKKVTRRPVPISKELADRLRIAANGRADDAPLLVKPSGERWARSDHTRPFRRTVERAGLDPAKITIYSLRHAAIIRSLLAGVPTQVVASNCDTSVKMLQTNYARYISDHSDTIARNGLLRTEAPKSAVPAIVVPLRERR